MISFSFNYFEVRLTLSFFSSRNLSVTFDIQIDLKNETFVLTLEANSRTIFKTLSNIQDGGFCKIVNGFSFLTIFGKSSILDVWQDSEFTSEVSNDLQKKFHLSCLTGF